MKKKIIRQSTIQLISGQAKPGVNLTFLGKKMALFCKEFNNNEKAKEKSGKLVNVEVTVYNDENYEYKIGTPPIIYLLKNRRSDFKTLSKDERKKELEKERKEISSAELERIAQEMMPSLNTEDLEKAKKIVIGTARSINIKVI
jgi:large subunit ribosomal protein L11